MKIRLVLVAVLALVLTGAACAASLRASRSGRDFDMKVGDDVFVHGAEVVCEDQLLTVQSTRPFARTLGRYALFCLSQTGSINGTYSVRISELGIVVKKGQRGVFERRNS